MPPAWTDVWICPLENGHLQATGRDVRRRKQYRYHKRWRHTRDETKYEHMLEFGRALPAIRRRIEADLSLPDLPRNKVLAAVVRLMEDTLARVGNPEYASQNNTFGLTTLRNRHVRIARGRIELDFRAKHGIRHVSQVSDRKLARVVKNCRDLPGSELFQYIDEDGERHCIDSTLRQHARHLQEVLHPSRGRQGGGASRDVARRAHGHAVSRRAAEGRPAGLTHPPTSGACAGTIATRRVRHRRRLSGGVEGFGMGRCRARSRTGRARACRESDGRSIRVPALGSSGCRACRS